MGNKRLIAGIIVIVILIIGLIATSYLYSQFNVEQLEILTEESNKILQMDIATDEIETDIKTVQSYGVVEQNIKEYIVKLKNIYKEVEKLNKDINPEIIFSAENVNAENKSLEKIETFIQENRQKAKEYLQQYEELIKEENILQNMNEEEINFKKDYFIELYKTVMLGESMEGQLSLLQRKIENEKDELYTKLNIVSQIKQYLQDNEKYWSIKDGKIELNANIMTEYYNLVNEIIS